jgi:3',5'-cyclic AMP phosphodiesterase CpdA
MSILLQISDPHFGTEQPLVAKALIELAQQQEPDLVILSGDITQRARTKQFAASRAFVDRISAPVLAIPGNHDIPLFNLWARWRHPYAQHIAAFGADLEPVHSSNDLLVVCVNTTRAYRHKNGEISAPQIARVAAQLASASDAQLRVVVVHQPVAVTRDEDIPNLLRGREAALERWATAGADIVMGGHIHLPYVLQLPNLARPMWAVQAGTAVSSRTRQGVPNSVNFLRCGADSTTKNCVVEQWDYSDVEHAFIRARVTTTTTTTTTKLKV